MFRLGVEHWAILQCEYSHVGLPLLLLLRDHSALTPFALSLSLSNLSRRTLLVLDRGTEDLRLHLHLHLHLYRHLIIQDELVVHIPQLTLAPGIFRSSLQGYPRQYHIPSGRQYEYSTPL